jgi:hypothetical protein
MSNQSPITHTNDEITKEYLREIAYVLESEDEIGGDHIGDGFWTKIQKNVPDQHFPKIPAAAEERIIVWLEEERYLVSNCSTEVYFTRLPENFVVEESPFVEVEEIEEIELTDFKEPEDYPTVRYGRPFPQTDFTDDSKEWLEENEIGEGCLPFRAVWYARQGEIIRHYEVEVPEGFKGWSEDEKGTWCRDKAHDLFGTHLTLSETEEEWGVDRIEIDTLEEAGFINENGTRHQIHRPDGYVKR